MNQIVNSVVKEQIRQRNESYAQSQEGQIRYQLNQDISRLIHKVPHKATPFLIGGAILGIVIAASGGGFAGFVGGIIVGLVAWGIANASVNSFNNEQDQKRQTLQEEAERRIRDAYSQADQQTQSEINAYDRDVQYPDRLSDNAKDLIQKLLVIDPSKRLGSGPNGSENIKNHKFFNGVSWKDIQMKKIKPPFIPKLKNDTDLRYFDTMFTEEPIDGQQRKNTNRNRSRDPSNEYAGFSYVTNSVTNELMTFSQTNDNDDGE